MYNAINQINSIVEILSSSIEEVKQYLNSSEEIDLKQLYEDIDTCKPSQISSALEAIYFSFGPNGSRDVVEDIYIKRIETELAYVIINTIKCKRQVNSKLGIESNNEKLTDTKYFLEDLWLLLEEVFLSIRYFYQSILGEDISLKSFESLDTDFVTINHLFDVIGYTDKSTNQKLSDNERLFIESFSKYCKENRLMDVSSRQLKDIAIYKRIVSRNNIRIPFMGSPTDTYRIYKVFKLSIPQTNSIFDLGEKELTSNHNPKNNVNTDLDEFFRDQYDLLFKKNPTTLFSFDYCLSIK